MSLPINSHTFRDIFGSICNNNNILNFKAPFRTLKDAVATRKKKNTARKCGMAASKCCTNRRTCNHKIHHFLSILISERKKKPLQANGTRSPPTQMWIMYPFVASLPHKKLLFGGCSFLTHILSLFFCFFSKIKDL